MFASSASIATLKQRAQLLAEVRAFFYGRQVLEVDVPLLSSCSVTDVHLDALQCEVSGGTGYLQTSPEFYMKRLLAMGSGDIFYLGRAFRQDESGRRHRPEFTMLEWYRLGFSLDSLIEEVVALIRLLAPAIEVQYTTYGQVFQNQLGINPHTACLAELTRLGQQCANVSWSDADPNVWLDLLFTHCVEPAMPAGLLIVTDYPASQAALARLGTDAQGFCVAKRFEVYWDGMELANGYWELTSADEQASRFQADLQQRARLAKPLPPVDYRLLAALAQGVPDCAGVALGFDRLLMKLLTAETIAQVIPFADG